ncbi:MAG: aspartate-semialdehyde dehydrogenase [Acidobacteriota bacterium]
MCRSSIERGPATPVDVGILGATGVVGQRLASLLDHHPWFRLVWVGASDRSAGQRYGSLSWRAPGDAPACVRDRVVSSCDPSGAPRVVFSALDAAAAESLEPTFAAAGHVVISNARSWRMDRLTPLVVPEINPHHLDLLADQRRARGWDGAIVTNPNCSTVFLAMTLHALSAFGVERVVVSTQQALSGAGHPGVASLDATANVIPFIPGEEPKIETETAKILGTLEPGGIRPHPTRISATATRVPVLEGHVEVVSVELAASPALEDVEAAFARFRGECPPGLPSAPERPIELALNDDRPQPRLDCERGRGMTVVVGRLRPCPALGYKFVALGHNLIRGAAGAALLNAELMLARGLLPVAPR